MRERLARVVGMIDAAARRRSASPALDEALKTLKSDYPDWKTYNHRDKLPNGDRFTELAAAFRLDVHAADLLAAAVAPELDTVIAQAYELLTGRALGGRISVGLALELAGIPTADRLASQQLNPVGLLRRGQLIDVVGDGGWLVRTVQVADRVRAHLSDDDLADPLVIGIAINGLPFNCPAAEQMARAVNADQRLIWWRSPHGTAGVSAAIAGFALADANCLVVDARLAPKPDLPAALAASVREAGLRNVGLVVTGGEVVTEPEHAAAIRVLSNSPFPVAVVSTQGWPSHRLGAAPLTIDAPYLTGADRAQVWDGVLQTPLPPDDGHTSVSHLRLTPEEILATHRYAQQLGSARNEPMSADLLRDAARALGAANTIGAGTGVGNGGPSVAVSFADLVLPERTDAELVRLVHWAEHRDEILARGTLHTKGGKGGGIAALFTGSPGTGKTLAAHVVADQLGLELMQIDLSAIVDKYIGETEKNLERVFRDAESRNVVLFFDEADSLFGSRSAVQDAHDRYANQEVSYLLQRMEHFDGITVLATNLRGNLDQAFLRRMQFIIHFPDPDPETRQRLWAQHLAQAGEPDVSDPVDVAWLAQSVDLAGGDIRNIVLGAAYDAAVAGRPVGHQIVVAAALREYQKLGRRVPTLLMPT